MWLVTGASGFVGRHVLEKLRNGGVEACGAYRDLIDGERHISAWTADVLKDALRGVTGVVHVASLVHRPSTPAHDYVKFNVEGTRTLLAAARNVGVRRFIFISSIKVHGETPPNPIDENTPVAAKFPYAQTKAEAERLVLDAQDLNPAVLRLCPVYGRGDKGNVRTMIRAISRRRFFVPGDGSTRKSIVHVSTVADVVHAAATKSATGVFVVADREAPSIRVLADTIAAAVGRRRPASIPTSFLTATASTVALVARWLRVSTMISADLIRKAQTNSICDPSRVMRELGVSCHVDLRSTLEDEIAWLRSETLL